MLYLLRSFTRTKSLLKVGYASDVDKRITQYLSHSPGIEPIATRKGDKLEERLIHVYLHFLGYGVCKDEWYEDCPEIITLFHSSFDRIKRVVWKRRDRIFPNGWWREAFGSWKDLFEYIKPSNFEASLLSRNRIDVQHSKYILNMDTASISGNGELDDIILEFNSISRFEAKMKFIVNLDKNTINEILEFLPENFKLYLSSVGLEKCRALKYNERLIKQEMSNLSKMEEVKKIVFDTFKVGKYNKYTLRYIKGFLSDVYSKLKITTAPKAADLEKYFDLKLCQITNKETGKRDKAFEIIKRKEG